MKWIFAGITFFMGLSATAQDSVQKQNPLRFSGFAEAYYSYDFNKPADNNKPHFLYSHNRHNEFNINLAYLKGSYITDRTRATIALGVGTYMNANYAAEPGVLKNIYEANIGVKIVKNRNLWIDAGVFPSHVGFESAHSPSCWTLTRSLAADNSPYFESGAKLTYISNNGKLTLSALALNGWQRIARLSGNALMSWGTQLYLKLSEKAAFNYSTFLGTDKPDSVRLWRMFHNIYTVLQLNEKIGVTFGFDIGTEQIHKGSDGKNVWYTPVGIVRFTPNNKWALALRGEYYSDGNGVIVPVATGTTAAQNGFKTLGASFNVDRNIADQFLWRTEIRTFSSREKIFVKDNLPVKNNTAITTSFALTF